MKAMLISSSRRSSIFRRGLPSRYFNIPPSSDEDLSEIDYEKKLFAMQRNMGKYYSSGNFKEALNCARDLSVKIKDVMGKDNSMYASSLSNIALMQKSLGETDEAMKNYSEALHVYSDIVGKQHPSYASTLANLGILFKTAAESSKGIEKSIRIKCEDMHLLHI